MSETSQNFDLSNWVTQARKGLLELCIVATLSKGEMHAYDLVKHLAGIKALVITEGTIYPLLSRLRSAGLLQSRLEESSLGPVRKYYALTDTGREAVRLMGAYWRELVEGVGELVESEHNHDELDTRGETEP
ncbi:MAG: PadR family transcriptional regulator [Candidatus Hydrogenedentes bacterium]|nr:PadR family transcriptional regulator [Candidatus Hydrogenedentota bacterium]